MAMRRTALAAVPATRTPERQALADAILERDRRAALVQTKSAERADLTRQYEPIRSRQFALEDDLKFARQRTSSDTERLHALLSGESLPEVTSVEAMRAELETVTAEVERLRQQQVVIDSDLRLLENAHSMAVGWVDDASAAVIAVEPATAAVVAEYARVRTQLRMLDRAIDGALTVWLPGQAKTMADHHVARGSGPLPPCPWQAARDRLASDPDARLPMPDDVFAEPPRPVA